MIHGGISIDLNQIGHNTTDTTSLNEFVKLHISAHFGLFHVEEVETVEILTKRDSSGMEGLWRLNLSVTCGLR